MTTDLDVSKPDMQPQESDQIPRLVHARRCSYVKFGILAATVRADFRSLYYVQ